MWKRLSLALPLAVAGAAWFYLLTLPWPVPVRWAEPGETAVMRQRIAEARAEGRSLEIDQRWVPLERISPHLRRAVLVAEDARFYEHGGVDWAAIAEELRYRGDGDFAWTDPRDLRAAAGAVRFYRENRAKVRGRSTLTQQLAKNLYFSTDRSLLRKLDELIVARRLERFLEKDRILELYLNVAEWGPGIFGAEAAAQRYFGRPAAELTRAQAAALAATLPHPLTSNPDRDPGRMAWRKRMILSRMGAGGPVRTVPLAPLPEPAPLEIEAPAPEIVVPEAPADTTNTAPEPTALPSAPDSLAAPPPRSGL